MKILRVIKTEFYKICHRKSSLILFIPMILAGIISWRCSQGMIKLDLTVAGDSVYSCMDFIFIVWTVLSGLGIMGILLILFSALQFSGEIERGQMKLMVLRIGKRIDIVFGKYVTALIVVCATVAGTLLICTVCYYLFISGSELGTGTFVASITGLSTWDILGAIALQMLMYLMLVGLTFLIGIFVNPFVTFVLTMVFLYVGNYLSGADSSIAKLLPVYWSNQIMLNENVSFAQILLSVGVIVMLSGIIIITAANIFKKIDIK